MLLMAGTLTVGNVEAIRTSLAKWLMNMQGQHIFLQFTPDAETPSDTSVTFGYLPEGYQAIKEENLESLGYSIWESSSDSDLESLEVYTLEAPQSKESVRLIRYSSNISVFPGTEDTQMTEIRLSENRTAF